MKPDPLTVCRRRVLSDIGRSSSRKIDSLSLRDQEEVALSGGPISVCALHQLSQCAPEFWPESFVISGVHILRRYDIPVSVSIHFVINEGPRSCSTRQPCGIFLASRRRERIAGWIRTRKLM